MRGPAATAYTLLDEDAGDPARPEHAPQIDTIAQDGRHLRLKLTYAF